MTLSAMQTLPIDLPTITQRSLKIVLADDEPDIRRMYAFKLTQAGFEVHGATDGIKALALIERVLPDVAVLDVSMPRLSGIEVCERLRDDMRTYALPVIMLTARAHPQDEFAGLKAGADAYLRKPFGPRALVARIWDLLSYARY